MVDEIKRMALMAAEAADDKKAGDIQLLDVRKLTTIADYFMICSGSSETQVKAIVRGIEDKLSEEGIEPRRAAGRQEAHWVVLDYADIVVHVFHEDERKYYELERLWADAARLLQEES